MTWHYKLSILEWDYNFINFTLNLINLRTLGNYTSWLTFKRTCKWVIAVGMYFVSSIKSKQEILRSSYILLRNKLVQSSWQCTQLCELQNYILQMPCVLFLVNWVTNIYTAKNVRRLSMRILCLNHFGNNRN